MWSAAAHILPKAFDSIFQQTTFHRTRSCNHWTDSKRKNSSSSRTRDGKNCWSGHQWHMSCRKQDTHSSRGVMVANAVVSPNSCIFVTLTNVTPNLRQVEIESASSLTYPTGTSSGSSSRCCRQTHWRDEPQTEQLYWPAVSKNHRSCATWKKTDLKEYNMHHAHMQNIKAGYLSGCSDNG